MDEKRDEHDDHFDMAKAVLFLVVIGVGFAAAFGFGMKALLDWMYR